MNWKKWAITSIVVFVVLEILNFLVHMVILSGIYQATASLWRSQQEMMGMMWMNYLVELIWAFIFVYVFAKGYEGKGWLEGLRFGLIIGVFFSLPMSIGTYVTQPFPFNLALYWFIFGVIDSMIIGIVASLIYKPLES